MQGQGAGYEGRFDAAGWQLIGAVLRRKRDFHTTTPTLVDLGTGRGRDILYLVRKGFRVLGIDSSPARLRKAVRRAERMGVSIRTELGDLRTLRLKRRYNVVFSSSALNHIPPGLRVRRFAHFKAATAPGGIHAVNALVSGPERKSAPDLEPGTSLFRPGELRSYYSNWPILEVRRFDLACAFGGPPHRHRWDIVIARKPG
jgi:tellurite methyltransferase